MVRRLFKNNDEKDFSYKQDSKQRTKVSKPSIYSTFSSFPDHTNENQEGSCCLILNQPYILLKDLESVVIVQNQRQVLYLSENNSGCG